MKLKVSMIRADQDLATGTSPRIVIMTLKRNRKNTIVGPGLRAMIVFQRIKKRWAKANKAHHLNAHASIVMMTAVIEIVKKQTKADISISGDITAKTHEAAQAAEVIASLTRGEKKLWNVVLMRPRNRQRKPNETTALYLWAGST